MTKHRLAFVVGFSILSGSVAAYALQPQGSGGNNCGLVSDTTSDGTETVSLRCCGAGQEAVVDPNGYYQGCVTPQGLPVPTSPTPWTPGPSVPSFPGGGGGTPEPSDPSQCKEAPVIPPVVGSAALSRPQMQALGISTAFARATHEERVDLFRSGLVHGYTLAELDAAQVTINEAERARWEEWVKTTGAGKKPKCNDKKKSACDACDALDKKMSKEIAVLENKCKKESAQEAKDQCFRGTLPNNSNVGDWEQAQQCWDAMTQIDENPWNFCGSAFNVDECSIMDPSSCSYTDEYNDCVNGYTAGSPEFAEHWGITLGSSWLEKVGIKVEGTYGKEIKWAPAEGTMKRCEKEREARKTARDEKVTQCKKAVEKKYPGGTYTCTSF